MASFRHAAYRASTRAMSALQSSRIVSRPLAYSLAPRSYPAFFSTRRPLFAPEIYGEQTLSNDKPLPSIEIPPSSILYVGNLFFDVTPHQLRQHFETYGPVSKTKIITTAEGHSKGFAFVSFESVEDGVRAQEGLNLSVFAGRRIVVSFAKPQATQPSAEMTEPTSTLFVGNMDYNITDKELNELFRPLKGIKDVRVSVDRKTGKPRGFAHADFLDKESAAAARAILLNHEVRGRQLRCGFAPGRNPTLPTNVEKSGHIIRSGLSQPDDAESSKQAKTTDQTQAADVAPKSNEGSHEPPQQLEGQPENEQEKEFDQPGEHATQQLEEEIKKVPEQQAEKKD